MRNNSPKVLFLSSVSPFHGPGATIIDYYNAFRQENIDADFLLCEQEKGDDRWNYVFEKDRRPLLQRLYTWFNKHILCKRRFFKQKTGHFFFYKYEELPPVMNGYLLKKITKKYDLVIVHFWLEMLNFSSIKAIYDKIHCQFQFLGVDYSQMSGGCHFIGDCTGYKDGCMNCGAVTPLWCNNFAAHNVKYRKRVYDEVKPVVWGNAYMQQFYREAYLLKDARCETSLPLINTELFKPLDKAVARKQLDIDESAFVLSFGSQKLNDERKGIKYLVKALNILYGMLGEEERLKVLVLTAGDTKGELEKQIPFKQKNLGYLKTEQLVQFYSASSVFLSPSVNDAGPLMVNHSLSCGTPVVAFDMGTALDCVKGHNTGFCVELRNADAFAEAVFKLFRMPAAEYEGMCADCREYAQMHYSYKEKVKHLLEVYNKYAGQK